MLATLAPGWSQQILFGLGAALRLPAAINFVSFFGVGLPLGTVLAYTAHMGAKGLWVALDVAIALIVLGQCAHLYLTLDWTRAARAARERFSETIVMCRLEHWLVDRLVQQDRGQSYPYVAPK